MSSRRIPTVSAVAATATIVALMLGGCAEDQPRDEPGSKLVDSTSAAHSAPTDDMRALGDALYELIDPENLADDDHSWADDYASIAYVDGTVHVYWVGSVPARVSDEIAKHPEVTTVVHEDAKYSYDRIGELQADVMQWIGEDDALGHGVYPRFLSVSDDRILEADIVDPNHMWTEAELEAKIAERIGMPVRVRLRHPKD